MATFRCGVHWYVVESRQQEWLPQLSVSARATICHNSARLTLNQVFSNPKHEPIPEAAYSFPIYEGAAIVEFSCTVDGRTTRGVVRDKHTARAIYEAAKDDGQQAALMLYNTPDIWSTKISNIPARGLVEVDVTVISELKHDAQGDAIRFTIPTCVAPRYGTDPGNLAPGISSQSRGIEISCAVTTTSPIASLQSPSHPIAVGMGSHAPNRGLVKEDFDVCKGHATLSQVDTALDRDFVLLIVSAKLGEPQGIVEAHPTLAGSRAVLLSLVPKFSLPRIKPEIVFVADRSGSMRNQIPQLKNALAVFLKSLPVGVKFNICSFGSSHSFLWPKSRPYDQESLILASKHVESFQADLGGTEMFQPIEETFKNRYKDLETEIMVLTDGEVWDSERLFKLVETECASGAVRLFSLGIGDGVSHALVEGLARAGRGYAQIVGNRDKLDEKVVQMLKASLGAHVKDYRLEFPDVEKKKTEAEEEEDFELVEHSKDQTHSSKDVHGGDAIHERVKGKILSLYDPDSKDEPLEKGLQESRFSHLPELKPPSRLQIPYRIPPLYNFSRTNVYILLSASEPTPSWVTIKGTTSAGLELELQVDIKDVGQGATIHQLAARKLLKELEEGGSYLHSGKFGVDPKDEGKFMDWIEREAVRVGTTFGVAGKWTNFVAVDDVSGLEMQIQNVHRPEIQSMSRKLGKKSHASAKLASSTSLSLSHPGQSDPGVVTTQMLQSSVSKKSVNNAMPVFDRVVLSARRSVSKKREERATESRLVLCGQSFERGTDSGSRPSPMGDHGKAYALLKKQAFDGSFPVGTGTWATKLVGGMQGWMQKQTQTGLRQLGTEELKTVLATALAIVIFQEDLKQYTQLWEMIVEKAQSWGSEKLGDHWGEVTTWVKASADSSIKESFWLTITS